LRCPGSVWRLERAFGVSQLDDQRPDKLGSNKVTEHFEALGQAEIRRALGLGIAARAVALGSGVVRALPHLCAVFHAAIHGGRDARSHAGHIRMG